jgi:hypothetical protein
MSRGYKKTLPAIQIGVPAYPTKYMYLNVHSVKAICSRPQSIIIDLPRPLESHNASAEARVVPLIIVDTARQTF